MPSPDHQTHTEARLEGVLLLDRTRHLDERGWFEVLDDPVLHERMGELGMSWQQWNMSHSKQGVLRGLHYQEKPYGQAKLIRVVRGRIWDVVVDLRKKSPTFGRWQGFELSADEPQALFISEGFAHGFVTLSEEAELIYAVSRPRHESSERVLRWDDPDLAIPWPVEGPSLSERDHLASLCIRGL
ncbi:dTDP-4-dehydrorhamnose 3,5-epimerase [Verrucomicrobiaceae bacterium N1E253]|uniref:dTDP-4-dehydrorhamnose 3,5-epimerase n=1 Tax=Oceaniferula marina TaxID=2748318 RepID=A0A851GQ82_9BACT|nr:dTDP-4-dehydrorhamnose 3,5-epimerase [Oceaniferula marina]NWK57275.1 dTDP-4-dehydrorhamnose 3,5-epimerase [Oceaniferula marina]